MRTLLIGIWLFAACALEGGVASSARAADWPHFRGGDDRMGIAADGKAPLIWSAEKNVKWKVELPNGGNSSPIVSGDRVFVNCAENSKGTRRGLFCFNRADGKQLWVKTVAYEKADPHHDANPYCASTPAADGKHVVVWHGSAGLYCYDYDGNELWKCDLGTIRHIWGYAGSPIIHGDMVYVNCGPGARSFVVGVDLKSGDKLWQVDEPDGADDQSPATKSWIGSWTTPTVATIDGREQVLVAMPRHVNAYDPKTGSLLWTCGGSGDLAYSDLMIDPQQNIAVALGGYGGHAIGFKPGGVGDITASNRLWQNEDKPPQRIGTGVFVGKNLFIVQETGFACMDPHTGKYLWQHNEPGVFWSSLVLAGDRLYATNQKGITYVIAADPAAYRVLAKNDVGEKSNSTLAIADGQIYLRTYRHLYCIEEK